jgi:hypothetical protein
MVWQYWYVAKWAFYNWTDVAALIGAGLPGTYDRELDADLLNKLCRALEKRPWGPVLSFGVTGTCTKRRVFCNSLWYVLYWRGVEDYLQSQTRLMLFSLRSGRSLKCSPVNRPEHVLSVSNPPLSRSHSQPLFQQQTIGRKSWEN